MKKILLLAITGAVILGLYYASPYASKKQTPVVQVLQPEINTIQDLVTLHGSIVDPERKKLYAAGASSVQKILVSEGEQVKAGQLLIKLKKNIQTTAEQSAAVSALVQLKNTLEGGDVQDAEIMLEDMITGVAIPKDSENKNEEYALYSPCDGMVMKVTAQQGSDISGILPCIEITPLNRLQIQVTAGEEVIGMLQPQMSCNIDIPAFSLEQVPGVLTKIDPYAQETGVLTGNTATETCVYITPTASAEQLRPGYRASAKIVVSEREDVLLLPYECILQDDTGLEYVLTIENNRLVKSVVLTGSELENQVEICDGLDKTSWVLQNPQPEWEGEWIQIVLP